MGFNGRLPLKKVADERKRPERFGKKERFGKANETLTMARPMTCLEETQGIPKLY